MNCTEIKKHLHEYASPKSDTETTKQIQDHLQICPDCNQEFTALKSMLHLMRQMPVPQKTDQQWKKIQDAVLLEYDKETRSDFATRSHAISIRQPNIRKWAIAAVLLLSTISALFYLKEYNLAPEKISSSSQEQSLPIVTRLKGTAFSQQTSNPQEQYQLALNQSHLSGETIRTSSNASIQLQTDSLSFLYIEENTTLKIEECSEQNQLFSLKEGTISAQVGKRKSGQVYRIQTPHATCEVVGTRFKVTHKNHSDSAQSSTMLYVLEGRVLFRIKSGYSVMVDSGSSAMAVSDTIIYTPLAAINIAEKRTTSKTTSAKAIITTNINPMPKQLPATVTSSGSEDIFSSATALIDSGMLDKAIEELRAIYTQPNISNSIRVSALQKEARCWIMKRDYSQAAAIFEQIINGDSSDKQKEAALFQLASMRKTQMHDFEAAINDLQRYITAYPSGFWAEEVYFSLAELHHLRKNFTEAAQLFRIIIDKYPNSNHLQTALYSLARLYSRDLQDCDHALGFYSRIEAEFSLNPIAEDALFWKAECLFQLKKISQSMDAYHKYLKKYPNGKWKTEAQVRAGINQTAGNSK